MKRDPHELQDTFLGAHRNRVLAEHSASVSEAGAALRTRSFDVLIILGYFVTLSGG
jgi:hypothetical protein